MTKHMTTKIRPAEDTDLEALCDLYFEFHEYHAIYVPYYVRSLETVTANERLELIQKVKEIIHGIDSTILVADLAGQVVGLAEIYFKRPDPANRWINPAPYAHLQSLVVSKPQRHKGIGSQLLQAAEVWSHQQGAVDLTLDVWEYPAGPLEFYQRAGYRTYRRSLIKKI